MDRILVTGANGQLGNEIKGLVSSYPDLVFVFTDIEELDITDEKSVDQFFRDNQIDYVVNCAGYTAVDKAEEERDLAELINSTAVGYLAKATSKSNGLFIHISTDYVFDGKKNRFYSEQDIPDPLSWYGQTKYHGEQNVQKYSKRSVIIRTSWLYSVYGANFVKKIIELGRTKDQIRIVNDQIGTPTYAADLADAIINIITKANIQNNIIYNFSNEGAASWYDFAREIFNLLDINCETIPVTSDEFPTEAIRPTYSVLDKSKIRSELDIDIQDWKISLKKCLEFLNALNK